MTLLELKTDDGVYARNEREEWEDAWVVCTDYESDLVVVEFVPGSTKSRVIRRLDELEEMCPNCNGMLSAGCCDEN